MKNIITELTGTNNYMSNDYFAPMIISGVFYVCVETALQAYSLSDVSMAGMFANLSGQEAKRLGSYLTKRADWDSVKWDVLYFLTLEKFKQNPTLMERLLDTGDTLIMDKQLGRILMRVRTELRPRISMRCS